MASITFLEVAWLLRLHTWQDLRGFAIAATLNREYNGPN